MRRIRRFMIERELFGGQPWRLTFDFPQAHVIMECAAVFADPHDYIGATVPVVSEYISYAKIAEIVSQVTGKPLKYVPLERDTVASFPFPRAAELANMFAHLDQFTTNKDLRPIEMAIVSGKSFKDWAEENGEALKAIGVDF